MNSKASNVIDDVITYDGPLSCMDDMTAGCAIENLGISVLVGPSKVMAKAGIEGMGVYIALNDDVTESKLPSGAVICGYSRGTFSNSSIGDKTVAFAFCNTEVLIFLNKKLVSLKDAIQSLSVTNNENFDLLYSVYGHFVSEVEGKLTIFPDENFDDDRYFIPFSLEQNSTAIINMGMMANDLAYSNDIENESEYLEQSKHKNVLTLVWRMELIDQKMLVPTWPVVILNRDLRFVNKEPMELGIQYSWRYWMASRALQRGLIEGEKGETYLE
eukprot:CAMPEP_0170085188 /NCGR_PEP_ID=MMETSP0019_2-20121128/20140_1 /TAXON_ID=98059 /ORGANISM="Dinobryon sp., Strain UTEXLB2267" /LENGTH=271 /DNA_ID=CAMNT_0010301537 /DNA_START=84 /DNA_END=899 /DNA_ORIENTATION=+